MRQLIMWNVVTVDGYFEGPTSGDIDWHERGWGPELAELSLEQLRSAGMLLFGRVTYEGMAAYWPNETGDIADLMNGIAKVVFSRTLPSAEWRNTRLVTTGAEEEVAGLKQQPGGPMMVFGSGQLSSALMRAGLIDEYRIGVMPILLGGGNPLFKPMSARMPLRLLEARQLTTGCVILRYQPDPDQW